MSRHNNQAQAFTVYPRSMSAQERAAFATKARTSDFEGRVDAEKRLAEALERIAVLERLCKTHGLVT